MLEKRHQFGLKILFKIMKEELIGRLSKFLSKIIIDNPDHFMIGKVYKHYVDTNPYYAEDRGWVYYMLEKVLSTTIVDSFSEYDHFHFSCDNGQYDIVKTIYTRRILWKFFNDDDTTVFKIIEDKYNFAGW